VTERGQTGQLPPWGTPPDQATGSVGLIHTSPPCQALSKLNRWGDVPRAQRELFPLLDQVRNTLRRVAHRRPEPL
jgi:hypothetical protein